MKITFKDVGQGDSILLEWMDDNVPKIGIIDCNKKGKANPILDYIKKSTYKKIEFIILSHPHSDHYSGMVELLNYLEEKKLKLGAFSHTLHLLGKDYYRYLNWVEIDTAALIDLKDMIKKVDELYASKIIEKIDLISENWQIELNDGASLKCLSPSNTEARKYMDIVSFEPEKNKKAASKGANYLSTIFKIAIGDNYYLLTSDSEILSFKRLVVENRHKDLYKKELVICQLPHHGASKNYYPPFWSFIRKNKDPQAVISAGLNEKYKHPHFPVLKEFHSNGYNIHSTNIVYGMVGYVEYLKKLALLNAKLDTFTEIAYTHTGGDKSFDLV